MKFLFYLTIIIGILCPLMSSAQIGYQVALLNTASGEPRANVTVTATVTISNSEGEVIYSGSQKATSNDFGVLQLKAGKQNTFKDVDWDKLPLYIEVSVDGTMIGKSQILSIPVAEAAKALTPCITKQELAGTWTLEPAYEDDTSNESYSFSSDGTGVYSSFGESSSFDYKIEGRNIYIVLSHRAFETRNGHMLFYMNGALFKATGQDKYTR